MQLCRTKFRKSFILSTKNGLSASQAKNPVNLRGKSGDITFRRPNFRVTVDDIMACQAWDFFVTQTANGFVMVKDYCFTSSGNLY